MKGQRALHEAQRIQLSRQGDAAVLLSTIRTYILETPVMRPVGREEGGKVGKGGQEPAS